jgi:tetratricopeptide (TPR) repeat protein
MKYTWLVEKYLEGELRGEELRNFELEILKNPEVSEEVERIRNLDVFSRKQYALLTTTHELLEDLNDIHPSLEESLLNKDLESMKILEISESDPDYQDFRKKVKAVSLRNYLKTTAKNKILVPGYALWITAACFMLLLTFTLLSIFTDKENKNLHNVYASFYQPYQADLLVRNNSSVETDPYMMGLSDYVKSNYGRALTFFDEVESGNEINKSIYLMKGICLMETGKYEDAILAFGFLSDDPVLNDYGQWYTGLCFLKLEQPDKARELFRVMSSREGYFRDMSERVLKRL